MARTSHSFRIWSRGRGGHESRLGPLCPVEPAGYLLLMGEVCFSDRYFVHHLPDRDAIFTKIFRRAIPWRCRIAVSSIPLLLFGNDRPIVRLQQLTVMKNEKLKSTTVRFTDSDLHLIDCLQEKLGLGMIHVIRLAIRRLAETENLLPSPSTPKKR